MLNVRPFGFEVVARSPAVEFDKMSVAESYFRHVFSGITLESREGKKEGTVALEFGSPHVVIYANVYVAVSGLFTVRVRCTMSDKGTAMETRFGSLYIDEEAERDDEDVTSASIIREMIDETMRKVKRQVDIDKNKVEEYLASVNKVFK